MILDAIELTKYAKNSYLDNIIITLIALAILTTDQVVILTIMLSIVAMGIYIIIERIIVKIKKSIKTNKKDIKIEKEDKIEDNTKTEIIVDYKHIYKTMPIAFFILVSNLIIVLSALYLIK